MPEANKNHGMDKKSRPPRYFRPQIDVAGEDAVRALASGKLDTLTPQALQKDNSVIYVDIDRLHVLNENLGMHVGDEVIVRVAEVIRRNLSPRMLALATAAIATLALLKKALAAISITQGSCMPPMS